MEKTASINNEYAAKQFIQPAERPEIFASHFNPAQSLDRAALSHPNRISLIYEEETCTVRESARITRQIAELLLTFGVRAGERVAFISQNSPYHLLIHSACARIGAVFVSISYRLQRRELAMQLEISTPKVIITDAPTANAGKIVPATLNFSLTELFYLESSEENGTFSHKSQMSKGNEHTPDCADQNASGFRPFIAAYQSCPGKLISFVDGWLSEIGMTLPQQVESWHLLQTAPQDDNCCARQAKAEEKTDSEAKSENQSLLPSPLLLSRTLYSNGLAAILFTSGSVGVPKAVGLTHEQLFWGSQNLRDGFEYSTVDPEIVVAPLTHIGGFNGTTLDLFSHGGTVVIMPEFDPGKLLAQIEKYRVALMFGVPTIYAAMLDHPEFSQRDLSCFRLPLIGGAAASPTLLKRMVAAGLQPINVWGMTETAASGCCLAGENCLAAVGSIGVPFPRNAVRIVHPETGVDSSDGTGELVLCGPSVIREYWNNPTATKESFDGPWLHTGDLVRLAPDGNLWVTGRIHNLINTGGEKVAPEEVERVLSEYPGVSECCVVGVPDEIWGEAVTAAFIMQRGTQMPQMAQLREFAKEKLAGYKLPKRVRELSKFPLTANGKIDRTALGEIMAES